MSTRKGRDLSQGSVMGHLLRFVAPLSLGIAASMSTGLVDAFWLGQLGVAPLAAVSFCVPVAFAVFSLAIGLGSGAVAAVSRAVGAGDQETLRRIATDALLLGGVVLALAAALGAATIEPLFRAMGAGEELLPLITEYMTIWYAGVVIMVWPMMASAIQRALGDAMLPSLIMIIAAIVNLVLDPLLIFGIGPFPRLEVAGAALATVIANATTFVVAAYWIGARERLVTLARAPLKIVLGHWRQVLRVGGPAALSNMVNPIALALIVGVIARFGHDAVAGFGAASRVEMFAIIPLFALSAAMAPMTGQNAGRGRPDRVRAAFLEGFKISLGWSVVAAILLAALSAPIARLFTDDVAAQAVLRSYLMITPITTWGYGMVIAAAAGFNGLGKPLPAVIMTIGRSFGLLFAGALAGAALFGRAEGAFYGMAAANVAAGVIVGAWILWGAFPAPRAVAEAR